MTPWDRIATSPLSDCSPAPSRRRNWAACDGTLLQISRNAALFSLIGTTCGGDGRQTFALPDLRAGDAKGQPVPFTGGCRSGICVSGIYPERP